MSTDVPASANMSEIFSAIMNEFNKASVATDLVKAQWQKIYSEHGQLNQFTPSNVKIISAKVSIPVAIDGLGKRTIRDAGVSQEQIADALHPKFSLKERKIIAERIYANLQPKRQNKLGNSKLIEKIRTASANMGLDIFNPAEDLDLKKIEFLQKEFLDARPKEQDIKFIYRVADLEKIKPESIIRFDLTIDIS